MSSADLIARLEAALGGRVTALEPLSGGCIANASRLELESSVYFLKWGGGAVTPTFPGEAAGLREIGRVARIVRIPEVIHLEADQGRPGFLILEWIETAPPDSRVWSRFGEGLAEIHRRLGVSFGFESDNFIGATPQRNDRRVSWPKFFQECRIEPQVALARATRAWDASWSRGLDGLYRRLEELLPAKPSPSLVHGDLWLGNMIADRDGRPVLIDPAVYYGHREVDLAMARLFGSPPQSFFEAYETAWPLEPGHETRMDVYNLYHLLNHLNLFGAAYGASVGSILRRFSE
jgi:fructosamine-3-kinase